MSDALPIVPISGPVDATVTVPGSKSITNRALLCASLAAGVSRIENGLLADDTEAMLDSLVRLGVEVVADRERGVVEITGCEGLIAPGPVTVDARLSGTTARFLLPVLACGTGRYVLDAAPPMRRRPMGPSWRRCSSWGPSSLKRVSPTISPSPSRGGRCEGDGSRSTLTSPVSSCRAS